MLSLFQLLVVARNPWHLGLHLYNLGLHLYNLDLGLCLPFLCLCVFTCSPLRVCICLCLSS